ncbi:MAG: flagellar brake protein [Syntrophomonadaceae bacterium]|nr:flagellar brake protein [Syntrophomonadaceae bacterium]MDD3888622.1 flagellar brake protein [Syntrophomonadaceae bacterium]MDD4548245.1 flagellar brake protein [Syntrophomonadaceae bacterium]
MKVENIKINQLIEIEVDSDEPSASLPSRIEEIKDEYLYISMPIKKGVLFPLRVGQEIKIIIRYRQSFFAFKANVVGRRREPIPILIINKPENIIRINQKREYVRLETSLTVRFRILEDGDKESIICQANTIDISAGGVLFSTKQKVHTSNKMEIELQLAEEGPILCIGKVVRVFDKDQVTGETKVAVEFDNISEGQRDKIFKYIFDKQREWIKKGLLD